MVKINRQQIIFFLIAIVHFVAVFMNTPSFNVCNFLEEKINFILIKSVSLILIISFWQFISWAFNAIRNRQIEQGNCEKILFVKYFSIYFLLNLIVLVLTYPVQLYEQSYVNNIFALNNYYFDYHPNWLQSFNVHLGYHFIPNVIGVSIFNSILYSLVFAYCVLSVKKIVNNKLYYLIFIPFCFPYVFVFNQLPIRMVSCAWLFIFVVSFILFNKNKESSNLIKTLAFSILAGLLTAIRSEYIVLLVFIPIFVYFNKIFKLRNFLLFVFVLFLLFFICNFKQKENDSYHYELHNLSYVYDVYLQSDIEDKEIEESSYILKEIYKKSFEKSDLASTEFEYEMSNKENVITVIQVLLKFPLKHPLYFIKKNQYSMTTNDQDVFNIKLAERQSKSEPYLRSLLHETFLADYEFQHKTVCLLTNLNIENKLSILMQYLYNPMLSLLLVVFSLFVGISKKQMFFVWNFVVWISILFLILIYMYWPVPHYYYAFVIDSWYAFMLSIISIFKKTTE